MSEKEKVKKSPRRFNIWKFLLIGSLAFITLITVLVILGPSIGGRIFKTSLDAEHIPTAEYLLENPMPNPHNLNLVIEQDTQDFQNDRDDAEWFCVNLRLPVENPTSAFQFEFDKIPVYGFISTSLTSLSDGIIFFETVCIYGAIENGLHIVTLHLNHEIYGGEYIHEWAIEIP